MGFWRHRRWLLLGVQQCLVHKRMGVRRIHKDIRNPMAQQIAFLEVLVGFVQQKRYQLGVQQHRPLQEGQLWQHDGRHMDNIHKHMGNRNSLDVARLRHQQIACQDSVRICHIRIRHMGIRIHNHDHNHNRNKHQHLQLAQHQQTAFHGSRSKLIQIQEQLLQAMKDVGS